MNFYLYFIKAPELKSPEFINGRSHVFTVVAVFDHLEASLARDIGQAGLNFGQVGDFDRLSPFLL